MEEYVCITCRENGSEKDTFKNMRSFLTHLRHTKGRDNHPTCARDYYDRYLKREDEGHCQNPDCPNGHPGVSYQSITKGYSVGCCNSCSQSVPKVREKTIETNQRLYGANSPTENKDIYDKVKITLNEKYGGDNPMKIAEFKNKSVETRMEHSDEITEVRKKTVRERYNVDNVMQHPDIAAKQSVDKINKSKNWVTTLLEYMGLEVLEYNKCSSDCTLKCVFCDTVFTAHPNHLFDERRMSYCPGCKISRYGLQQSKIKDFCSQYYSVIENDRKILAGKEIDILIPEIKIGIEYDGLYWHSENFAGIDKNYHRDKTINAHKKGIKLMHIFEDEWLFKQDIVKSILLNKLGKTSNSVGARSCKIVSVNTEQANVFYDVNHLQGHIGGVHYGLSYNNDLVSCVTIGKSRYSNRCEHEIYRFCNKIYTNVNGSFSKLFKYFITKHDLKSIVTYSDLRYGQGLVYSKCGFKYYNTSSPNYFYIKNTKRESRNKYQKHKLSKLLEKFDPNISEWENMKNNNFDRIYDCGNNVFEWYKTM